MDQNEVDLFAPKKAKKGISKSKLARAKSRLRRGVEYNEDRDEYILHGVKSFSDYKSEYTVDYRDGSWACSCQSSDYGYLRPNCTHILAVRLYLGETFDVS